MTNGAGSRAISSDIQTFYSEFIADNSRRGAWYSGVHRPPRGTHCERQGVSFLASLSTGSPLIANFSLFYFMLFLIFAVGVGAVV